MQDITTKLILLQKKIVTRINVEPDIRKRIELQCLLASIDNMLDIVIERIVDEKLINVLLRICHI